MSLLSRIDLDDLSPAQLWTELDATTREEAARAAYAGGTDSSKAEADLAIAQALRFRPNAVRQLPLDRRVNYLLKNVYIDDNLASTLLLALHLGNRKPILETFLDALEIPQSGGLIDDSYDLDPPDTAKLASASTATYEKFEAGQVDLYLAALLVLDPGTWDGLRGVIADRVGSA